MQKIEMGVVYRLISREATCTLLLAGHD